MFDFLKPKVPTVTVDELKKAMDAKENFILLDVRTENEFARGNLDKSVNCPVNVIETKVESIVPDKSSKVYVYCLSGSRSIFAVDVMVKKGYTNTFDVSHGLLAWRVKGYPENS